ncbi:MAG: HAD-IIIA family hydrolase, partial [Candidatus Hydrogenedentes bacterium]|nr:HAD-IIIA family hydrolase [Candidatus Hydrogenedentota bacterium]
MKAVIIAGGKGTRIRSVTGDALPKALLPVAGLPIIFRQFQLLKRYGFSEVVVTAGHLAPVLSDACARESKRLGLRVQVVVENQPMGTGGGLPLARRYLGEESFLVVCGDIAVDMDLERLAKCHRDAGAGATVVVHPNDHPQTSDLVVVDDSGYIREFLPRGTRASRDHRNLVIGSLYVLSPRIFDFIHPNAKHDLNNEILPRMVAGGAKVLAYNTPEYLRDVGTPERLALVERDIATGRMERLNWGNKRPAVFFDRDGVLIEDAGERGVTSPDEVVLLPGAAEAVRAVNAAGWLAVVISNQPGVAKGFLTFEELDRITGRLEMELGYEGAWLDRVYYCPHHPESGFEGERPELKVTCDCRKPAPGLLLRAAEDLPIDLPASVFIGDTARDVGVARAVGIPVLGVRTGNGCQDCNGDFQPDS